MDGIQAKGQRCGHERVSLRLTCMFHVSKLIRLPLMMLSVDHPHGGGRGKSKGNKHPRTPQGLLTKGRRTRRPVSRIIFRYPSYAWLIIPLLTPGTERQQACCSSKTSRLRAQRQEVIDTFADCCTISLSCFSNQYRTHFQHLSVRALGKSNGASLTKERGYDCLQTIGLLTSPTQRLIWRHDVLLWSIVHLLWRRLI